MLWRSGKLVPVLLALARAHMQMIRPAPLRSPYNQYVDDDDLDSSYNDPLGTYPCKGYHLDSPRQSTAIYRSNQTQVMVLDGETPHKGGSCQISLSYDGGKTFGVIKSIIGGCPMSSKYYFDVPTSAPSGQALFAWTWISHEGDRDLYMNCAWVDIETPTAEGTEWSAPPVFVSQLPGYCTVPEYGDYNYPDPSDQVEYGGDPAHRTNRCDDGSNPLDPD